MTYDGNSASSPASKLLASSGDMDEIPGDLDELNDSLPRRVNVDPDGVEKGLAQLVLTLVELLRQLMERQAVHRMEANSLADEEIERLGQTFIKLDRRMDELLDVFGLDWEDLNLNLGPLGDLM